MFYVTGSHKKLKTCDFLFYFQYTFNYMTGFSTEIEDAIGMIRDRFPEKRFPYLTLEQVNRLKVIPSASSISLLPPNNKVSYVSSI